MPNPFRQNRHHNKYCSYFPTISFDKYEIYDIYNNAYTHGGRLNVTFDRYFVYDVKIGGYLSESQIQLRSKYANRRNLSDITIRVGLIVSAFRPLICDFESKVDSCSFFSWRE